MARETIAFLREHRHARPERPWLLSMLRDGRYKFVRCREPVPDLLFDVQDDPLEQAILLADARPEHAEVADRMRKYIDERWDCDVADEQTERDQAEARANALPRDLPHVGNLYLMPDRRLVAADTPLYDPPTLTHTPQALFADWPDKGTACATEQNLEGLQHRTLPGGGESAFRSREKRRTGT